MLFHESRFATRVHDFDAEDDPAVLQILRVKAGSARTRGRHKDQMQMRSYFGDFNRSVEDAALWGWPRGRRGASTPQQRQIRGQAWNQDLFTLRRSQWRTSAYCGTAVGEVLVTAIRPRRRRRRIAAWIEDLESPVRADRLWRLT